MNALLFKIGLISFFVVSFFIFSEEKIIKKTNNKKYNLKGRTLLKARKVYKKHCLTCHQRTGRGLKNTYPPLKGSEWLKKDKEILIKIILHGLEGEITVKGKKYNNKMLQLGTKMKDKEIAQVLTYVRQAWGNKYNTNKISAKDVAKVRKKYKKRKKRWLVEEIEKSKKTK